MIINGDIKLRGCTNLRSLGKLKIVNGDLSLWTSYNLESLGDLEEVHGDLSLRDCINLKSLGKLKLVTFGYSIILFNSGVTEEYIKKEKPWLYNKCMW